MPYINVKILEGATREQKQQVVQQMTQTLVTVLGKRPETIHIVIDEVRDENWGFGGLLTADHKRQRAQQQDQPPG